MPIEAIRHYRYIKGFSLTSFLEIARTILKKNKIIKAGEGVAGNGSAFIAANQRLLLGSLDVY
jgi:hypothetical protein